MNLILYKKKKKISNSSKHRFILWGEIKELLKEVAKLKTGNKKAAVWEIAEARTFWLGFFGFSSLGAMNIEELDNFKALLEAKIKVDYKRKCLPGIIKE